MKKVIQTLAILTMSLGLATGALAAKVGNFELKMGDKKFNQEALKGKKSVLIFVQAACSQCGNEMEELKTQADALKAKAELYVVIVDVNAERALEIFKKRNTPGTLISDPGFDIGTAVDVGVTPATVVVDKELNVLKVKTGYKMGDLEKLAAEL